MNLYLLEGAGIVVLIGAAGLAGGLPMAVGVTAVAALAVSCQAAAVSLVQWGERQSSSPS